MIPWFQYTVVHIGPFPIQVWGFFVALGMLTGIYIIHRIAKKKHLPEQQLLDIAFWMILWGVVGARIAHVFFYDLSFFIANPLDAIKIWEGGMSSFGGMAGAALAFVYFARTYKLNKEKIVSYADLMAFAGLFGWIIGRIGCFMIHDHLGKPCDCFLAIDTPTGPRLDMAFLEILALLPLALYFFLTRKTPRKDGWYLSIVLIYYGVLRFVLDFFRATDLPVSDARYLGLTPGQYFAIVFVVFGLWSLKPESFKTLKQKFQRRKDQ